MIHNTTIKKLIPLTLMTILPLGTALAERPPFAEGQIVVKGSPEEYPDYEVIKHLPKSGLTILKVQSGKEFAEVQKIQKGRKEAALNMIASKTQMPNDSLFSYQWNFNTVQAHEAWEYSTGAGVKVAVLDTGLAMVGNDGVTVCEEGAYDFAYGDDDPDDLDGHGTHVSGTIAQKTNNGTGTAGLAYDACVMPVKVLNDDGFGSFSDIAEGIYHAVASGANVINMSLGIDAHYFYTNDYFVDDALDYAYDHGVTVVAAAGNDGFSKIVSYPAVYPSVIAVGATGYSDRRAYYSNYGTGLDVVAPGGDFRYDENGDGYPDGILQETRLGGQWSYFFFQGTSMASPHVAAIAALLKSAQPALSPDDIYFYLTSTTADLGRRGYDKVYGHGLVQAADALRAVTD